jgi:glutamine amidotransferase
MRELEARGLREAVIGAAASKPFLGICVGEQMLFEHSEEGDVPGLGIFPGEVRRFPAERMVDRDGARLKVPHMGWNEVWQKPHALWAGIADGARFYFVHSYCVQHVDPLLTTGTSEYGIPFTCAVGRDNIFAVQFHPEKSARDGLQLLKNFVGWRP